MSTYEISKSSLLSLKAEILRKQDDLSKAKIENNEKLKTIKKKALELKNKGVEQRSEHDLEEEDQDLLKLSKSKLEAKTALYEKLSNTPIQKDDEINQRYLVRFDKKNETQKSKNKNTLPDLPPESDEEKFNSDYNDDEVNSDEEWIEYTDALGRSRKCLRKDLQSMKARDDELRSLAEERHQTGRNSCERDSEDTRIETEIDAKDDKQSEIADSEHELMSGEMRRETLRKQWEKEEEELRNKTDVHYQNILFDEARQHGVGYYAFSKDDEERAKQQEALEKLRLETEQQQKKAQDLKALREKQMAARMKAARNRRRARLGLPLEEDEPEPTPQANIVSEEEKKLKEKIEKLEEAEKLLNEARKRHVRPWDIGKKGVTEFHEMSQSEWNEKKRKERPAEFAPPTAYSKREFTSSNQQNYEFRDSNKSLKFSTIEPKKALKNLNPYKKSHNGDKSDINDQVTKDSKFSAFHKNKSYQPDDPTSDEELTDIQRQSQLNKPVPIVNELEEDDFNDTLLSEYHKMHQAPIELQPVRRGVEIAPPATIDYYGPSDTKRSKRSNEQINISKSIEAGLKFLRNQEEQKQQRRQNS